MNSAPPSHRRRTALPPRSLAGGTRHPWLAVMATALGTTLAMHWVPEDPQPQLALFAPAFALAAGLLMAPLWAAIRDPKSLLCGEHLLTLAPIYWLLLDLLQGAYELDGVTQREARLSFLCIGLFVASVWAASLFRPIAIPGVVRSAGRLEARPGVLFGLALCAFAAGMFKFAQPCGFNPLTMIHYLGENRWGAPWTRGFAGGWDAFRDVLQYFGYLLPTMFVLLGRKAGWFSGQTLTVAVLAAIQVLFLAQEGGRRTVGVACGMAIIFWLLTERRLGLRGMLVAGVAAVGLLALMEMMLNYRNVGFQALVRTEFQSAEEGGPRAEVVVRVDDNFLRLAQSIHIVPNLHEHTHYKYFLYVLVRPIPRVFWPGKPTDPGFDLPEALGLPGVSLSSSIVGELWVAGGFWAVAFGGLLYGLVARSAGRLLSGDMKVGELIIYCTTMMALFAGFRSMLDLVLISYVILAWIALAWLYQFFGGGAAALRRTSTRPARVTP